MASQAQIDANRRNSEKSTGPTSDTGKAASRMNALKSGLYAESIIIRGETAESFDALTAQYQESYRPQTAGEQTLVDSLVTGAWLLRRLTRTETQIWEQQFGLLEQDEVFEEHICLADALDCGQLAFSRQQYRYTAVSREFRQNLKELTRLQDARRKATPPVETEPVSEAPPPQPADTKPPEPEIGFVPSNPPAPEPEPVPCPHRPAAVVYAPVQKLVRPHGHVQKPPRRFNWNRHKPHRPSRLSGSRHTVAI
jgi:hypothetical protein